ncbi:hypothetical protein ABT010_39495 [Streptomyces sp. NPDC002668]|uniref:hypothetical protein n=1 Tax=Streptomyces sp. NPDC002668 TaxID=3154422 RepID=UPI0033181074
MHETVTADAARPPTGRRRPGGALSELRPRRRQAQVIRELGTRFDLRAMGESSGPSNATIIDRLS